MRGKQKRFLRAQASTMQPVVMIGKGGLENAVIDSARAAISARELIKVKVLNNAPVEQDSMFEDLATMLGAELVQIIGHNAVLYKEDKSRKKRSALTEELYSLR